MRWCWNWLVGRRSIVGVVGNGQGGLGGWMRSLRQGGGG